PEPLVWQRSKRMSFVGEIQKLGEPQGGTLVRIDVAPLKSNGEVGDTRLMRQEMALRKKGTDVMAYCLNGRAPKKPGHYRVTVLTVGPDMDFENLVPYVVTDVQVK